MKKVLIALIALALVTPVVAQEVEEPPPIVEAAHNQVARFLRLSAEQVASWDAVYENHREAERPLKAEIAALQDEIDTLFAAGDPDPAALGELVIARHAAGEALWDVHLVYHDNFVALLEEDQARRLGFIARADDAELIIPAFKLFELIPRR
jgi:hypothetical protein